MTMYPPSPEVPMVSENPKPRRSLKQILIDIWLWFFSGMGDIVGRFTK